MANVLEDPVNSTLNGSRYQDLVGGIQAADKNRILLDNLSNWYIFNGEVLMGMPILRKYENIIKTNVQTRTNSNGEVEVYNADLPTYKVPKSMYYRPEYLSYALYDTTDFWYLILFINNMKSPDEFIKPEVKVFPVSLIETLNKIYNAEKDMISSKEIPRIVNKEIMRSPDLPSYKLLSDKNKEYTDWLHLPSWNNNVDLLFKNKFNKYKNPITMGKLINKSDEYVDPFRLNNKGLFNVPSVYFKDGYWQYNKGRIKLKKDTQYSLIKSYNGYLSLNLKYRNDPNINIDVVKNQKYVLGEPKLISDYRKANDEDQTDLSTSFVKFDQASGKYKSTTKKENRYELKDEEINLLNKTALSTPYMHDISGTAGSGVRVKWSINSRYINDDYTMNYLHIERFDGNSNRGGIIWRAPKLEVGQKYTVSVIVRGRGKWDIGHEQGGYQTMTDLDPDNMQLKQWTFTATNSQYGSFIFYAKDNGDIRRPFIDITSMMLVKGDTKPEYYHLSLSDLDEINNYHREHISPIINSQPIASMRFTSNNVKSSKELDNQARGNKLNTEYNKNTEVYDGYFPDSYEYNVTKRRMDLTRIEKDQFLSFTLEYDSNFSKEELAKVEASSYKITLLYDDNSTITDDAYIKNMAEVYNTQGIRSFLNFTMINPHYQDKKIIGIQFDALCVPKDGINTDTINFDFNVYSFRISSQLKEKYVEVFTVPEDGWYDIYMQYEYAYNGNRRIKDVSVNEDLVFDKEDLSGILFSPQIRETYTDGSYNPNQPLMMSDKDESQNEVGISMSNPVILNGGQPKYNELTKIYTTDLNLADEYILTVKINHTSIEMGGGVGFLFDYDYTRDTGYLLWITSVKDNPNLPKYNKFDDWNIMPSGFYQVDNKLGELRPIFDGDKTEGIFVDDGYYFDPENMVIKIIKKYNRIRMFDRKSNNPDDYDYYEPFFHYKDPQDPVINGGLGFWSYYAGARIEVLEYYPYVYQSDED